jgi:hypothetical protein
MRITAICGPLAVAGTLLVAGCATPPRPVVWGYAEPAPQYGYVAPQYVPAPNVYGSVSPAPYDPPAENTQPMPQAQVTPPETPAAPPANSGCGWWELCNLWE